MKKFLRDYRKVGLLNFMSRVLGFGREVVKAQLLGTTAIGDAFQIAFILPNLFRRLTAEGVMLSTFLPIFSEVHYKKDRLAAAEFLKTIFCGLLLLLCIITLVFTIYADVLITKVFGLSLDIESIQNTILLTRIMFSYIIFISLAALLQGVLNYQRIFWVSALTPSLFNISIISCGIFAYYDQKYVALYLAYGVLLGGLIQFLFHIPFVLKQGYNIWRTSIKYSSFVANFLKTAFPGLIGAGIYQIDLAVSNIIATTTTTGSVIALNLSNRLTELVLGIFVVSQTTILLPIFADYALKNAVKKSAVTMRKSLSMVSFITLPVTFGFSAVAEQVVRFLFQRGEFDASSVALTTSILVYHLPGLIFIGWNRVLVSYYHAKKLFFTTMRFSLLTLILNIILSVLLSRQMNASGIALASSISQAFIFCLLSGFLFKNTKVKVPWSKIIKKSLIKHLIAAFFMYIGVRFLQKLEFGLAADLFLQIAVGIIIYLLINVVLRANETKKIFSSFSKHKKARTV